MDNQRLVFEYNAMMERWPALGPHLCRDKTGRSLWWEMVLRGEGGNQLPILIEYPPGYPASPPTIVIGTSLPVGTPHLLPGNRMCWYYPGEHTRDRNTWCPSRDTAAMCVGVAQRWFYAFLVWLSLGKWPVPDAAA
jgi:ubiquitin-protein ligase